MSWFGASISIVFSLMLTVLRSLFAAFGPLVVSGLVQTCLDFSKLYWGGWGQSI